MRARLFESLASRAWGRLPRESQSGFTIIEVLVAATLLVVGVLGASELANVANRATATTDARNGATSLARRVIEAARGIPAPSLTQSTLMSTLQAAVPDIPSTSTTAWTVNRQGFTYTITPNLCTVDDPGDGIGAAGSHDSSYCSNPAPTNPPDPTPADFQKVTVVVSWAPAQQSAKWVTETTEVPFGSSAPLPSVTSQAMTAPFSCASNCPAITSQSTTAASFAVTASNSPNSMTWLVNGSPSGTCPPTTSTCSGSGSSWAFTWTLGTPTIDTTVGDPNYGMCVAGNYVYDGTYQLGAQVADSNGLSGAPGSTSVSLNRCAPIPPPGLNATGRSSNTAIIDTEWQPNPEGDIVGYRVYKGTSTTNRVAVCPPDVSAGQVIPIDAPPQCVDPSPPSYSNSPYYYAVYAVDLDPSGARREGAVSYMNVNTGNHPPNPPQNFAAARNGTSVTLTWTLPSPLDPDPGDTIASFRIYRVAGTVSGSPTYLNRYDRDALTALCTGTSCSYTDTSAGSSTETYWVTSVDTHLLESSYTAAKSA